MSVILDQIYAAYGTVENPSCHSINGGLFQCKITRTVPLNPFSRVVGSVSKLIFLNRKLDILRNQLGSILF